MLFLLFTALLCARQGAISLTTNPVLANGIAGLAASATTFAGIEVGVLCMPFRRLQGCVRRLQWSCGGPLAIQLWMP